MRARRILAAATFVLFTIQAAAQSSAFSSSNVQLQLERLANTGSVLMLGAHPDDENTSLLAYLALGRRLRTGYLSLTRGEGGQNAIGPEQGALLGIIREQELLAARRIDGAEQYFTSAVDFGYSKSAEETLQKWNRDRILGEIVGIIRQFQPDVVILRWTGTPADGHGHHQAAGILGLEAVKAAGDPSRYSNLHSTPWSAKRVFFFQNKSGSLTIDTGKYDPLLGYSYAELAGISSSQHRSQAMGSPRVVGPARVYLDPAPAQAGIKDVMEGVETGAVRLSPDVAPILDKAVAAFDPKRPYDTISTLLQTRRLLRSLSGDLVARKLRELDEVVLHCAGMFFEAAAASPHGVAGSTASIQLKAVNRSPIAMTLEAVDIDGAPPIRTLMLAENVLMQSTIRWTVRETKTTAQFRFRIGGEPILASRPVVYRYVDKVLGDRTQPFVVVPPVSITFNDRNVLFSDADSKRVSLRVKSYVENAEGKLSLTLPAGWSVQPPSQNFRMTKDQSDTTLSFEVTPGAAPSAPEVRAAATIDGREVDSSITVVRYPHIPTQLALQPAKVRFTRADVRTMARKAGYIEGAGDEVPAAMRQLGCMVTFLTAEDLANGDLDEYDVIVTGVRAFNLRDDLRANMARLNEYVHKGGSLVVQYNTAADTLGSLGPYPIRVGRSRISMEDAPVTISVPRSAVLNFPNKIGASDFEGWVQERGLYFPSQWDPRLEAPLTSNDPGEAPQRGGILVTKYGEGAYVYTSYSWFRQLPAGVPGAYRLFANLLSQ